MSLHDLIAEAKPPARTVEVCLRGDLLAALEVAARNLALLAEHDQPLAEAQDRVAAIRADMSRATITVTLTAMPRRDWLALIAEHAPRDGNPVDERAGFNTDEFYPAIVRGSWTAPEASDEDIDALLDRLNARQFDDLADAAFSVNARSVSIPFGWRDWQPTPD